MVFLPHFLFCIFLKKGEHLINALKNFFRSESAPGILIIIATVSALICQNTFLSDFYNNFLRTTAGFIIGDYPIVKPMLLWVNDGLMALFFFYIGLEVKREILIGELSSPAKMALPLIGGIGGIVAPALIFILLNWGDSFALRGWAIPTVSDTAFAIGILMLLKSVIPPSLKIFLLLLAIIDDICAVIIIAVFYTSGLSTTALVLAGITIAALAVLCFLKINSGSVFVILGLLLWVFFLESGVHSTIAGILTAFFIPLKSADGTRLLENIEHSLSGFIPFFVMPVFAFVNAGIALTAEAFAALWHTVPIGIFLGLVVAKPLGIYGFSYLGFKLKLISLPSGANHGQFFGLSVLTGIGASMSLFINSIAYHDSPQFFYAEKIAILLASLVAAVAGFYIIKKYSPKPQTHSKAA